MPTLTHMEVYAGFNSLQSGMNGGVLNTVIPEGQFAKGINVACRNGVTTTRPPVTEVTIEGSDAQLANISGGKFQGMYYYQYEDNNYIAFGMSGVVYLIDPITSTIWDMTAALGSMSATVDRLHFCQVERYLVVQDGVNTPVIIEDTASRLSVLVDDEVPIGTIMAYCHGRLFIKTGQYQFIAGDIQMPNAPGNVLLFAETVYLAGGGALFIPADMGQITGMSWAHAYGEATGEGPLLVFCESGIASFAVNIQRLSWQDMPIMKIEPAGNGNASEYCIVKMNEDMLFMSWKGLQDFALLSVEAATHHRMTNLDVEVAPFTDLEDIPLRSLAAGCKFDDRLLYTAIGEAVETPSGATDYRYAGLISLDFSPADGIASLGQTLRPSYDGLWTGFHPMGLESGLFNKEEMCFIFGKDNDGVNHLYRLQKELGYDSTIADGNIAPECKVYTKGYAFISYNDEFPKPVPHMEKELTEAHIWLQAFRDDVEFALSVCPDFSVIFHQITSAALSAPMATTATPPVAGSPQPRAMQKFPAFVHNVCEQLTGKNAVLGHELQFLLEWSGVASVTKLNISATARRVVKKMDCSTSQKVLLGSAPNDFLYDINDQS